VLPETDDFRPSGTPESPLANITSWVNLTDPRTGAQRARSLRNELGCPRAEPGTLL
jgi:hypothetical protein